MGGAVVATGKPGLVVDLVKEVLAKQNVEVAVIKMALGLNANCFGFRCCGFGVN